MSRLNGTNPLLRYEIADEAEIHAGDLVALDSSGKAIAASDTADLRVIGVAKSVSEEGVEVEDGVFAFANDGSSVTRAQRGQVCMVKSATSVAATSTNSIAAGLVVDVYGDEVYVDLSLAALALASAPGAADVSSVKSTAEAAKTAAEKAQSDLAEHKALAPSKAHAAEAAA